LEATVQNAKDTFYEVLRGRLAVVNPERTIVVRGVTRPGVLVEENELATSVALPDCFRLRWTVDSTDSSGALPMVTMLCSIDYETAGSADRGGMDRGRMLAAMDAELAAAVNTDPSHSAKNNYSAFVNGSSATAMGTNIWWGAAVFGRTEIRDDRVGRTATVAVMSYQESGEL